MLMQRAARPPRAVPAEHRMEMLGDAYSNSTFTGARRMKRDGEGEAESRVAHANLEADYFASGTVMR